LRGTRQRDRGMPIAPRKKGERTVDIERSPRDRGTFTEKKEIRRVVTSGRRWEKKKEESLPLAYVAINRKKKKKGEEQNTRSKGPGRGKGKKGRKKEKHHRHQLEREDAVALKGRMRWSKGRERSADVNWIRRKKVRVLGNGSGKSQWSAKRVLSVKEDWN